MSIRVRTLGGLSVNASGRVVVLGGGRCRAAILAWLAVERKGSVGSLAALLWPGRDPDAARRSLTRHIERINRALGRPCIRMHGERLRLSRSVHVDVHDFEQAIAAGASAAALQLYRGPFLDDFRLADSPAFEQWLLAWRTRLADAHAQLQTQAGQAIPPAAAAPAAAPREGESFGRRLLGELQRRRVIRVAISYLTATFIVLNTVPNVLRPLGVPELVETFLVVIAIIAFPVALILSWAFELTPEGELRRELPGAQIGMPRWHGRSPRRLAVAFVLIVGLGFAAYGFGDHFPRLWTQGSPAVEPMATRYVILPLHTTQRADSLFAPERYLYSAFGYWTDIEIVTAGRVAAAIAADNAPRTQRSDQRLARELGAGRYVRGTFSARDDSAEVYLALHDAGTGEVLADTTVVHGRRQLNLDALYVRVAAALLFRAEGFAPPLDAMAGSRSFPALLAFAQGEEALADWDLAAADSAFNTALRHDPRFAIAALRLAQTQNWNGADPRDVQPQIERAHSGGLLPESERVVGDALLLLALGRFDEACAAYGRMIAANALDLAAWYGWGECHGRDRVVVADSNSPSGYTFRSSPHQAIEGYRRAFALLPSLQRDLRTPLGERARQLLFTSSNQRRSGALQDGGLTFLARAQFAGDTLAFVPWPRGTPPPRDTDAAASEAVERQRRRFQEIAVSWVEAFPRSVDALEALAFAQEMTGDPASLETMRRARVAAVDRTRRAQLAAAEALLLLRFATPDRTEDLTLARALADTVLATLRGPEHASLLAICAVLTGRVHSAAAHASAAATPESWSGITLPASVKAAHAALLTYAALGVATDSLLAYEAVLEEAIRNRVPRARQADAREHLMVLPAVLAFPTAPLRSMTALADESRDAMLRAQTAFATGDTRRARFLLDSLSYARRNVRPAERAVDNLFTEASLRVALGDTARAVVLLDSTLSSLRWSEPGTLAFTYRVAALVRALALRAALAEAAHDPAVAARWATPVVTLWANAHDDLQHLVRSLRTTAASGSRPDTPIQGGRR